MSNLGQVSIAILLSLVAKGFAAAGEPQWWRIESKEGWTVTSDDTNTSRVVTDTSSDMLYHSWNEDNRSWSVYHFIENGTLYISAHLLRKDELTYSLDIEVVNNSFSWTTNPIYSCMGSIKCDTPGDPGFTLRSNWGNWSYVELKDGRWGFQIEETSIGSHTIINKGNAGPGNGNWSSGVGIQRRKEKTGLTDLWRLESNNGRTVTEPSTVPTVISVTIFRDVGERSIGWIWNGDNGNWTVEFYFEKNNSKVYVEGIYIQFKSMNEFHAMVSCNTSGECNDSFDSMDCHWPNETSWMLHTRLGSFGYKTNSSSTSDNTMGNKFIIALPEGGNQDKILGDSYKKNKIQEVTCEMEEITSVRV